VRRNKIPDNEALVFIHDFADAAEQVLGERMLFGRITTGRWNHFVHLVVLSVSHSLNVKGHQMFWATGWGRATFYRYKRFINPPDDGKNKNRLKEFVDNTFDKLVEMDNVLQERTYYTLDGRMYYYQIIEGFPRPIILNYDQTIIEDVDLD